jgi:hypothetical protein
VKSGVGLEASISGHPRHLFSPGGFDDCSKHISSKLSTEGGGISANEDLFSFRAAGLRDLQRWFAFPDARWYPPDQFPLSDLIKERTWPILIST